MFKIILLAAFLFLFMGLKAQQTNVKKTEVIEHREGSSQELKAPLKQVKNLMQAFPKPIDSVRSSAKMKPAIGNQTIPKPVVALIGETKRPTDCLAPMVMARIAAALSIITQAARFDLFCTTSPSEI